VVYDYYNSLKAVTDVFATPDPTSKPEVTAGLDDDRYAYSFKFRLPIQPGTMKFEK